MSANIVRDYNFVVIIATKNRAEALKKYALPSLEHSVFQDAVCLLWDASEDDSTQSVVEQGRWDFSLKYMKAPRAGLTSQRNDATEYVLKTYPSVRYLLFIDDDSELSSDALQGVTRSFEDNNVWGVNIPHVVSFKNNVLVQSKALTRRVTSYLHNRSACPEPCGIPVEWLSGCGMAFRIEVFRELGLRFPEIFQKFGGYALGEDLALSFYLHKKLNKKMINAEFSALRHHSYGSARLDIERMAASKWYNFHLLFDAIYDDIRGYKYLLLRAQFKLFMCAAALKLLIRARSFDGLSVFRGIKAAGVALREYRQTSDIKNLMRKNTSTEDV